VVKLLNNIGHVWIKIKEGVFRSACMSGRRVPSAVGTANCFGVGTLGPSPGGADASYLFFSFHSTVVLARIRQRSLIGKYVGL